jgi:hypothetical protein
MLVPTGTPGVVNAVFNTAQSDVTCAAPGRGPMTWQQIPNAQINCEAGGSCLPPDAKYGCTAEIAGQCVWDTEAAAMAGCGAYQECQAFFCSTQFSKDGKLQCFGRMHTSTVSGQKGENAWVKSFAAPLQLQGEADLGGLVNLSVSHDGSVATITMNGPDGVWFGVGFDAAAMSDLP